MLIFDTESSPIDQNVNERHLVINFLSGVLDGRFFEQVAISAASTQSRNLIALNSQWWLLL